jgi:glucose dehydrogenase
MLPNSFRELGAIHKMRFRVLLITTLICTGGIHSVAQQVPTSRKHQRRVASVQRDWPVYGGQLEGDRYSALTQINRKNVRHLKIAWTYDSKETGGLQTSPLVVGRVVYGYTPTQKVIALDGATGKLLWTFDSGIKGTQPARGLARWSNGKERRLLAGVMNFLYALNPATGRPIATFGENGRIDLRKNLRGDYTQQSIALTSPGIVFKDLIILGGRNPETHPSPPGDIRAFDVRTGKLRWSFHTIPHPGEFGYGTWPKDAWQRSGAANNWTGMALDAKRGIVYVPTGSAVSDFYGNDRLGNNLFADTLLALDAATGKRLWHFQGVHHDIWDRDFPSPPSLVTVMHDGKKVEALAQTTKQGYLYLFDRTTGRPLFPIEETAYRTSDVPGEVTSPTQPRPTLPEPFARQTLTEDMLTQRTPEAHQFALEKFRSFRNAGIYVPFSVGKQTVVFPGFDGGAEWGGSAVDVKSGVIYINANEMAWTGGLTDRGGDSPGETVYMSQCVSCHGEHREGSPPAFPSLVGVDKRLTDTQITNTILQGKGRMPAFPVLNDDRLVVLLQFLKSGEPEVILGSQSVRSGPPEKQEMSAMPATPPAVSTPGKTDDPAGAQTYKANCSVCHGENREGKPPTFPALMGVGTRLSREQIGSIVHSGKNTMPAFPQLQGEKLAGLLRYLGAPVKTRVTGENSAGVITQPYRFTGYRKFLDNEGYPAIAPPWGTLNAIDLNTGRYLWKVPLGEYPELADTGMRNTGSENYGGPIVTAGGIVFIGATIYDQKVRAFDSRTGTLLWESTLPFSATATPATYMIGGRQFIVTSAGGGKDPKRPSGGLYVAFALPDVKKPTTGRLTHKK